MLVDLSEIPHAVRVKMDELIRGDYALRIRDAIKQQQQVAAHYHRHRPRSRDGLGEHTMAVHQVFDVMNRLKRGEDWDDPNGDYRKWWRKKNPEVQVRATGTKIQVGYTGTPVTAVWGGSVRERKTYPAISGQKSEVSGLPSAP